MAHDHILVDDDNRFIIDGQTRQITNITGNHPSVMQFDHNSEKLSFQMPLLMEGHDMSECDEIKILYKNTGKGTSASTRPVVADVETITDITVDEDEGILVFTWTIPEFATIYSGTIVFQFKFICYGDTEDDPPKFKLYTEQYSFIEVRPSLDISKILETQFPNLLDEIETKLRAFENEFDDEFSTLSNAVALKANAADIATTTMHAMPYPEPSYVKIYDFGEWGSAAWYQKGFSMLVTSRAGETVWVSVSSDDDRTNAKAIRLMNSYSKIASIYYNDADSALYLLMVGYSNNVNAHIISNIFGDYVAKIESVPGIPSTAVHIPITELGPGNETVNIGNGTLPLDLRGSADRPAYNGVNLALQNDLPSSTKTMILTYEDGHEESLEVYVK